MTLQQAPFTTEAGPEHSPLHPSSDLWSTLELVTFGEPFNGSDQLGPETIDPQMLSLAALVGARNRHPTSRLDNIISEKVLDDFERIHYAFVAPTLDEQCLDVDRTTSFDYMIETQDSSALSRKRTELFGLRELRYFLEVGAFNLSKRDPSKSHDTQQLLDTVTSIRDRLTFIGDPEFQKATMVLGAYWKKYLSQDPLNQIFVVTGISNSDKYPNQIKSDKYLFDAIDRQYEFTTHGSPYEDRLSNGVDKLETADPKHTKIILLDDWALSGGQISREYFSITDNPKARRFSDSVEANFIAASDRRISLGIDVSRPGKYKAGNETARLPVRSVFQAHQALVDTPESSGTHITGLHSSANFGFSFPLDTVYRHQRRSVSALPLPSLAQIIRNYSGGREQR